MRLFIIFNRKKRGIPAAIAENLEEFLVSVAVCGGEHEEHYAEMVFDILLRESVVFLEQFDASPGRTLQNLAIRMFFVPKSVPRLCIDGFGRHEPQHETCAEFQVTHCLDTQQGFPATCRDFQADVWNRFTSGTLTRNVF